MALTQLLFRARRFAARRLGVQTAEMRAANGGERQAAPTLDCFRADHRGRYRFAARQVRPEGKLLDLACGVGYGCRILAEESAAESVLGIDLSAEAIAYGAKHFAGDRVQLRVGDALQIEDPGAPFDLVTSFETLEHLEAPRLLPRLASWLAPDGLLIASVPNERALPFSPERFPYHLRHYTAEQFEALLQDAGLEVLEMRSQHDADAEELQEDRAGLFLVAVCRRARTRD
ncbi:MAG: class I SAM-dependent methyltransferase [Planctomycetes bacterium]|nr:class I SAM-dependent methyltransferase [Planctomycetota bacterium]